MKGKSFAFTESFAIAVFVLSGVALFVAWALSLDQPEATGSEPVIVGSVEELDDKTYHCFRYDDENRGGGLWCQEIER